MESESKETVMTTAQMAASSFTIAAISVTTIAVMGGAFAAAILGC